VSESTSRNIEKKSLGSTARPSPNPLPKGEGNQTLISQVCYCHFFSQVLMLVPGA